MPYSVVHDQLSLAEIGLHTMKDEHFGITLVEFMSAGVIVLAANSGGPKDDILTSNFIFKFFFAYLSWKAL